MNNSRFWVGKRVWLTGHTGFKGGWLSLWLKKMGAHVFGYALAPPTDPNFFEACQLQQDVLEERADVRELSKLQQHLRECAPDIVFHLAAQPLVRASYQNPVETYDVNVMGTVHVLEAIRQTPSVRAAVMVTSDKCYDNRESMWPYRETDAMGGHDPYSSSKGCAELVTAAYARSFFSGHCSIASVRAGNVIGGGDFAKDRLMPDLIRGLWSGNEVRLRFPNAIRPWQHVLEPLHGYLQVAQRLFLEPNSTFDSWNFGPHAESFRTVRDLAQTAHAHMKRHDARLVEGKEPSLHEAHLLTLDSTKARVELGWKPRWNFEQTVAHTVTWYQAFLQGEAMKKLSLHQIEAYENQR